MTDYTELKRLAEAAPEGPWFGPEYAPGTSYVFDVDLGTLLEYQSIDSEKDACLRYVAAANPAAFLALIAENESLRKDAEIGRLAMKFVDRMDDPADCDPLVKSAAEFLEAIDAAMSKAVQP